MICPRSRIYSVVGNEALDVVVVVVDECAADAMDDDAVVSFDEVVAVADVADVVDVVFVVAVTE